MYEGKEVCQGCGKSGSESPRVSKNTLCDRCKEELRKAKSLNIENSCEYVYVAQHIFACNRFDFNDNSLNELIIELLLAFNNPYERGTGMESIKDAFGDNKIYVNIPKRILEPLKKFAHTMEQFNIQLRKEKDAIPEEASKAVQAEKDKIYNEGIMKGRDLLFQLNNNEISQNDFIAPQHYKL